MSRVTPKLLAVTLSTASSSWLACCSPHVQRGGGEQGEEEQLPVFLANPDLSYANQFHLMRFTNGAFHLCLQALYKVQHSHTLSHTHTHTHTHTR
jgi:hypothetical protein